MLDKFGHDVGSSISGMKDLGKLVKSNNLSITDSAESIGEIINSIKSTSLRVEELSTSTSNQTLAITDISRSLEGINLAFGSLEGSAQKLVSEFNDVNKLIVKQIARLDRYN